MKLVYPMRADGLFILKNNDYEQIAKDFLQKYDDFILCFPVLSLCTPYSLPLKKYYFPLF